MKKHKIELLAPAGSFEALKAAVSNGADAVYLGGGKFNARVNAGNFSDQELIQAFDYAHERGVRAFITLNTLIKNEELEEALQFTAFAYENGADAIIVQDLGLLSLIGKNMPGLELHASTQMTTTNLKTVLSLERLGVKRVVLSRELSLEEIGHIASKCKAELEIFVHGALCVSYSGQCLMSSFIGGRSGNRGVCAQPCRLPWSLSKDGSSYSADAYLISPRDLMAIDFLPQLESTGVRSLKLEGRMKSAEYVAIITSTYRKYLDLLEENGDKPYKVEDSDRERLMQAFNRGGFTQNYLVGDRDYRKLVYTSHPKNQGIFIGTAQKSRPPYVSISLEKPLGMGDGIEVMDPDRGPLSIIVTAMELDGRNIRFSQAGTEPWVGDFKTMVKNGSQVYKTFSKPLFEEARNTWERGGNAFVPLDMSFSIKTGQPANLHVTDDDGNSIMAGSGILAEKALNRPLSTKRIREQLEKTGDTPYWLRSLEVSSDGESVIPVSILNAMRREALEKIGLARIGGFKRLPVEAAKIRSEKQKSSHTGLSIAAYFYDMPHALSDFDDLAARVYLPIGKRDILSRLRGQYGGQLFLWTPSVLKDTELEAVRESLKDLEDLFDGVCCGNLGALDIIRAEFPSKALCADFSMNIFNDEALSVIKELGANTCVLSPELRLGEVREMLPPDLAIEALVYGRVPLMTMEHCPSAAETACSGICDKCPRSRGFLKDRKGEVFPFTRDPIIKRTRIFNAMPLFMDDTLDLKKTPVNYLRLSFTHEDQKSVQTVLKHYANKLKGLDDSASEIETVQKIKAQGFTKGHWFRGV